MEFYHLILESLQQHYLLIIAFFFIAILYASVGFGGGSSYSALLSLTEIPFIQFRAISLLCNITVVFSGSYLFYKNKLLDWKKVLPLVFFSVPLAFLGGFLKIDKGVFYIILSIALIVASGMMLFSKLPIKKNKVEHKTDFNFLKNSLIGGTIGFISGMVGIGGGVFLAPLLHTLLKLSS
jgi:uncharacterized membrane protein YfcA